MPYVAQVTSSFHLILLPHFTTTAASLDSLAHFLLGFVHLNSRYYSLSSPSVAFHPLQTCENVLPLKFDLPKLEQEGV